MVVVSRSRSPTMSARRRRDHERARRFEMLYVEHYGAIYAFVYRRLSESGPEAPDVVAEVFATAWRRLDSIPHGVDGRLWLYRTAQHVVLNDRRGWRRRLRLFDRLAGEARSRPAVDDGPTTDDIWRAIERLPFADREVLRLVSWEGCSHAEAAAVLGCSVNAVALRLRKAKLRLSQDPDVAVRLNPLRTTPPRSVELRKSETLNGSRYADT